MSAGFKTSIDRIDMASVTAALRPALIRFFRRKCDNAIEAEDLAQDVLVRALACAEWESLDQAKGYIFRSAINRWNDRQRRRGTHGINVAWDDAASYARDEGKSPERVLIIEEELHRVIGALEGLNERTRDVFMLIRVERMRQAEVAAMLGISVSAVEKQYAKALAHLTHFLAREEQP